MHVLSLFIVLLTVWVLLSGQFTLLHLGLGVACSLLVTYLAVRKGVADAEGHPVHFLSAALIYWPWLLYEIVLANMDVIWRVWHPRLPIAPRLIRLPCDTRTDLGAVIYANSITLTPGTVTVALDKRELLVHALTEQSARLLTSGEMIGRVKKLEFRP